VTLFPQGVNSLSRKVFIRKKTHFKPLLSREDKPFQLSRGCWHNSSRR
jgi:hypothetical protein